MNKITLILIILITFSCSNEKSDSELLEIDKEELKKIVFSEKVMSYKFGIILLRASAEKDTTSKEFNKFKSDIDNTFNKVMKLNNSEELSILETISIYQSYKKMNDFIQKTDEDTFPTLTESINCFYADTLNNEFVRLKGNEKKETEAIEHGILSAITILTKDLGKEVSIYECFKTNPKYLEDSEIKSLIQFYRGFAFFEKKLFYLSENEYSNNINWLNKNKKVELNLTRSFFRFGNLSDEKTHIAFRSLNYLFRGFDRLMMERKVDEERALEDFEEFLSDSKKLNIDNELIWSIEVYLYLKKGENEKAILSLAKLKTSSLITIEEKDNIDKSIIYLKQREPDKVLNGFYDKFFLSKIASKFILNRIAKINWEQVLKDHNISHSDEIIKTIEVFKGLEKKITKLKNGETIGETGKEIKEKSSDLLNKAKDMINN